METTSTQRNLNYNFIAVPTNLFFTLDINLRNALTVLLQLSSVFADADGYFFRTIEDLKDDFKCGKNLTIAILESLYRYQLIQVKSVGFTKKNGKKQVNFYRVNVDKFKDFEAYNIYTITNNKELQLETVDYKAKDYKVTYTASTVDESNLSPTDVEINETLTDTNTDQDNGLETKETALTANTEDLENLIIVEDDDLYLNLNLSNVSGVDEVEELKKEFEESEAEEIKIEKAVFPTPTNIEYRTFPKYSEDAKRFKKHRI